MAYKFLTTDDLHSHIIDQFLNERNAENQTTILEHLELQNIEIIKTKLRGRYDTEAIFNTTNTDRHYLIVRILVKLVLYDFIRRNAARKVPTDYVKEWEWAMKILEKIKAGKEVPDGLPLPTNENGDTVNRLIHGNNKNNDYYL